MFAGEQGRQLKTNFQTWKVWHLKRCNHCQESGLKDKAKNKQKRKSKTKNSSKPKLNKEQLHKRYIFPLSFIFKVSSLYDWKWKLLFTQKWQKILSLSTWQALQYYTTIFNNAKNSKADNKTATVNSKGWILLKPC